MKYTDRFFEFPVRVYDRYTAEEAMTKEKDLGAPMEGEWVEGNVRINFKEITVWSDYFDSTQGVDGVVKKGFEATIIWTKNEGVFISPILKKDFEARLNKHADDMEKIYEDENVKLEERISRATGGKTVIVK